MQLYQNADENAPVTLQYASFWKRMAAIFIDAMIISFVLNLLILPLLGINLTPELTDIPGRLQIQGVTALIGWLYYAGFESSARQATPGKQIFGIFVTDTEGYPISFARATGRYFGKMLSGLILLIGYVMAAFTERRQALHDKLAHTLVLQHPG
ncbi:MAG: RDD family protein [Pontibacter sp.]|nr:RDD family protein [Pontibacter sp.]